MSICLVNFGGRMLGKVGIVIYYPVIVAVNRLYGIGVADICADYAEKLIDGMIKNVESGQREVAFRF